MINKQEAIETIKNLNARETFMSEIIWVKRDEVLDIIKQLDEPKKTVVPQFVADWYEEHIGGDFEYNLYLLYVDYYEQKLEEDLKKWIGNGSENKSIQTLVNMHQFGYEVEKEKLYTARLKIIYKKRESYINKDTKTDEIFLDDLTGLDGKFQVNFTQAELEELNVWDNPAFEVKEVKK